MRSQFSKLLLVGAMLLLAACGHAAPGTDASPSTGQAKNDLPGFGKCMRGHGIDIPDPDPNNGAQALATTIQDARKRYGATKVQSALTECQSYLGGVLAQKKGGQATQQLYDYFSCLRDHGADIGDPDPKTGKPSAEDIKKLRDPDPTTKKAIDACQDSKPGTLGGGH